VEYSKDGKFMVSGDGNGEIRIWDVEQNYKLTKVLIGHERTLGKIIFDHTGKLIFSTSRDSTVRIWKWQEGECLRRKQPGIDNIFGLTRLQCQDKALIATHGQGAVIIDVTSQKILQQFSGHKGRVWSAELNFQEDKIVTAGTDHTIKVWDVASQECLYTLKGHEKIVYHAVFSKDGEWLLSCSGDKTIRLWSTKSQECVQKILAHDDYIRCVAFSSDSQTLASGSNDKKVKIWNHQGELLFVLDKHQDVVRNLCFHEDILASSSRDGFTYLWNYKTGKLLQEIAGQSSPADVVSKMPYYAMIVHGYTHVVDSKQQKTIAIFPYKIHPQQMRQDSLVGAARGDYIYHLMLS
jgi:WD40 repeat protein